MKTLHLLTCALAATSSSPTHAFLPSTSQPRRPTALSASRREALVGLGGAAASVVAAASPARAEEETELVKGEEDSELVKGEEKSEVVNVEEEPELIKVLKARSEANAAANKAEATRPDKLSSRDFSAQYLKPSLQVVQVKSSGEKKLMETKEVKNMVDSGKVVVEFGVGITKGGEEFVDYQKKTYVLLD